MRHIDRPKDIEGEFIDAQDGRITKTVLFDEFIEHGLLLNPENGRGEERGIIMQKIIHFRLPDSKKDGILKLEDREYEVLLDSLKKAVFSSQYNMHYPPFREAVKKAYDPEKRAKEEEAKKKVEEKKKEK